VTPRGAAEGAVQHRHVPGIDHVLEMLKPIAGDDRRPAAAKRCGVSLDELAVIHALQAIVSGSTGRFSAGPRKAKISP
jgi:hypothetical protein